MEKQEKTELTPRQIIARRPRMHVTDPDAPRKRNRADNANISIRATSAERDILQALATAAQQDMRSYIATAINQYAGQTVIALTMGRGNHTPRKPAAQPESDAE